MEGIDQLVEDFKEAFARKLRSAADWPPEMLDMIIKINGIERHMIIIIAETDL
jgi:hypothetical protein